MLIAGDPAGAENRLRLDELNLRQRIEEDPFRSQGNDSKSRNKDGKLSSSSSDWHPG
jgi:hypothetical protein